MGKWWRKKAEGGVRRPTGVLKEHSKGRQNDDVSHGFHTVCVTLVNLITDLYSMI